jgi:tripartite-type tricarboxylate transporter receptor subunit TctC
LVQFTAYSFVIGNEEGMMNSWNSVRILIAIALLAVAIDAGAQATGNYPSRPVRMIVPFAPGGASDAVARVIQPPMQELLKEPVVIDNRAGADGNIGVEATARAAADGYTILLGNIGTMAINPNYFTQFPIKPATDLVSIIQIVDVPGCLVSHPSLPAKTLRELIDYVKANPGKLNYGSPANSSANRLDMEGFLGKIGGKVLHVPYKGGAGPATIGLLGNEVQIMFVTLNSTVNFIKQGRLRAYGVVAPERVSAVPDLPTMREQGYDMTVGSWQGVFSPKGTPRPIVDRLFAVMQETMKNADVRKRLEDTGTSVVVSKSPEEFLEFVNRHAVYAVGQVLDGEEHHVFVVRRHRRMHRVRRKVKQRTRSAQLLGLVGDFDPQRTLDNIVPLLVGMRVRPGAGALLLGDEPDLHALAFDHRTKRRRIADAGIHARHLSELENVLAVAGLDRALVLRVLLLRSTHIASLITSGFRARRLYKPRSGAVNLKRGCPC